MTNDIPSSPSNRSLAIRWIAATSIVAAVGFGFYRWGGADAACIRLVASFATEPQEVERFIAAVASELARGA